MLSVRVTPDQFTEAASRAFDYNFSGESFFTPWPKPEIEDFSLGLIVGPSGSGKSLLLREFGEEEQLEWNPDKAVVSHFASPEDALTRLMAVGLNSIPAWCKPFHVLSNGERFRCELARRLKNNAVIDEFTSVVDRNVAKAASCALRRFIDREGLRRVVLASCHSDILEWLRPDWWFDTADGTLHDGRSLRRPNIEVRIYPCSREAWRMFSQYHYLSSSLNPSSKCYLATASFKNDAETIVGMTAVIHFPHGFIKKAKREHRTVILPDFQGLGLGPVVSDAVAQLQVDAGFRYFSRTAHPRFGAYRDKSPLWRKTSHHGQKRDDYKKRREERGEWKKWVLNEHRVCFSHEYIGKGVSLKEGEHV